jgi:3-hydroxy-9,10-secoandrosta-1,3,5(10)-triene-9,17-dione monooxygenase
VASHELSLHPPIRDGEVLLDMTPTQFHDALDQILPGVAERAVQCERERGVPDENIKALVESGITRAFQPARWGGAELDPLIFFEGVSRIAEACASTAWVTSILGVHSWQLAMFSLETQAEVWGDDSSTLVSSSYAPTGKIERVDGGYRVSGRWNFSSGCEHADWAFLGGIVPDGPVTWGGLPDIRTFLLPRADYTIDDVWFTAGLAGTGSNDIVVDGAFVPEHRTLPFAQLITGDWAGKEADPAPLYHAPFAAVFVNCLAAPAIGNARAALDRFIERSKAKVSSAKPGRDPLEPWTRALVAEGVGDLESVTLQRRHDFTEIMDTAVRGETAPLERRARYRWNAARAACISAGVLDRLFDAGGGHGIYLDSPDQRAFRDGRVMAVHAYTHRDKSADVYSRVALGYQVKDYLL